MCQELRNEQDIEQRTIVVAIDVPDSHEIFKPCACLLRASNHTLCAFVLELATAV